MKRTQVTPEKLSLLFENLRKEDVSELKYFLKTNIKENFIDICLKQKHIHLLVDSNKHTVAIGGIVPYEKENILYGQIWLLCSNIAKDNKKELFKYIKKCLDDYKREYDFLFNYIYKTNFKALLWLKKYGFKHKKTNNKNLKLFYFNRTEETI